VHEVGNQYIELVCVYTVTWLNVLYFRLTWTPLMWAI